MTIGHTCPVDGNTNVRTCLDVPETHLVGVLVCCKQYYEKNSSVV